MNPDDFVQATFTNCYQCGAEVGSLQYRDLSPEFRAKFEAMEAVVEAAREAKKFLGMDRPIDPSDILIDALAALDALEEA